MSANGHRITWKGTYALADAATLTGLHVALQAAPYNFVAVGAPVYRTFMTNCVAATALYTMGTFSLICMSGTTLYLTAMIRGSVDRTALKALIKSTFGLTNEVVIEDDADL